MSKVSLSVVNSSSLELSLKIVWLKFPATVLIRELLTAKSFALPKVEIEAPGGFCGGPNSGAGWLSMTGGTILQGGVVDGEGTRTGEAERKSSGGSGRVVDWCAVTPGKALLWGRPRTGDLNIFGLKLVVQWFCRRGQRICIKGYIPAQSMGRSG